MGDYFNSHAHVERDYSGFATGTNYQDFNSHAHVERDKILWWIIMIFMISTHTLTWSVTKADYGKGWYIFISTHTLTWSVTYLVNAVVRHLFISTHTLTWSVTISAHFNCSHRSYFNSHAHVERDF